MNKGACMDCRQRAGDKARVSVVTCACGWTASYCHRCGGRKRADGEVSEHRATCISAVRRSALDARIRALPRVVYVASPPPKEPDHGR